MKRREVKIEEQHPCTGCHYWRLCGLDKCCNFIFIEGHMRGCPPGEGCIRKIPFSMEKFVQERQDLYRSLYFGKQPI